MELLLLLFVLQAELNCSILDFRILPVADVGDGAVACLKRTRLQVAAGVGRRMLRATTVASLQVSPVARGVASRAMASRALQAHLRQHGWPLVLPRRGRFVGRRRS